ncbi:presenilin-2 isoform X2 [Tasmannia lanceolata]|uniref:presenilin-2 isoform X2 n=1 Tax=Tasmannia lanceolata TaxID=3420 RepID=UPI00406441D0
MDQGQEPTSILEFLGEEIIRIIVPVSTCMFLVVVLVTTLNASSSSSSSLTTIATIAYDENTSDSDWSKFTGYLVVIGMLVAYWFTLLPEWTTWVLLVAMALYDLAAVLLPGGPLRLLVELAMSRDEEIPALVYEARPVTYQGLGSNSTPGPVRNVERRLWKEKRDLGSISGSDSNLNFGNLLTTDERRDETRLVIAEEGQISAGSVSNSSVSELSAPLIARGLEIPSEGQEESTLSSRQVEGIGLGSSGAIKLGLGDFIFYSVLVGRAAMYDFMTVYACYLAIIAGLGITLMLLAVYQKALPALPVSILLGTMFYVLTRFLLEAFVFQCSINLLMF